MLEQVVPSVAKYGVNGAIAARFEREPPAGPSLQRLGFTPHFAAGFNGATLRSGAESAGSPIKFEDSGARKTGCAAGIGTE